MRAVCCGLLVVDGGSRWVGLLGAAFPSMAALQQIQGRSDVTTLQGLAQCKGLRYLNHGDGPAQG